jgi:hemerythrin-like metal-binding protein
MTIIPWGEQFLLGIEEMDEEHKIIVEYTNDLEAAMLVGRGGVVIEDLLQKITVYAQSHFSHEEELMRNSGYPGLAKHKEEHDLFLKRIDEYYKQLEHRDIATPIDVLNFLRDWLQHHLLKVDKRYADYLKHTEQKRL